MKKLLVISFIVCIGNLSAFNVGARSTKRMGITIAGIGDDTNNLRTVCQTVKNDLLFTGQFTPDTIRLQNLTQKQKVTSYKKKGELFLAVWDHPKDNSFEWRLYDTATAKMLVGKRTIKRGKLSRGWGHALSDRVLEALTSNKGSFSSKLVYCKEDPNVKNKTKICVADYDGKHEQTLASLDSLAIAPRWNNSTVAPVVLYSEYTASNMRLMTMDLKGERQIATSFDGLNMLPSFSPDGKEVVVCLSVEGSAQLYRYAQNKRTKRPEYIRLTHNTGSNISPAILKKGDIAFCSDFETGRPHIYIMNKKGKNIQKISDGGSSTSPSYSSARHKIAYSKLVSSVSQIMVYDIKTKETRQVTTDPVHKEEPSWSPCGNYLVFSVNDRKMKRLAVQNLLTKKRSYITDGVHRYSYPSWSPHYGLFPEIG